MTEQTLTKKADKAGKVYINSRQYDKDFSGQDLTHADFRGSKCINCNFSGADLSYANFEGANLYRSSFVGARVYHTSFKDATLTETIMDPSELFGATITLTSDTFSKMKLSNSYASWLLFLLSLAELDEEIKVGIRNILLRSVGDERLASLERTFVDRKL